MDTNRIIIDVREPSEYQTGHIPGALNIPPSELIKGSTQLDNIDKSTVIIVYCKTGSRSSVAINILKKMGFTKLINGINAEHVAKNYNLIK